MPDCQVETNIEMDVPQRRALIEQFFTDVHLPQRRRLLSIRDHTLVSTGGSSGNMGEMVASMVSGVRGNQRKGKTAAGKKGDLSDGCEVKAYTVCETNVDFLIHGTLHRLQKAVVFQFTRVDELRTIALERVEKQVNYRTNLLQALENHDDRWIGSERLYKTSGNALKHISDGGLEVGITLEQLKHLCRENNLPHSGSKIVLYQRLQDAGVTEIPDLDAGWYLLMRSETEGDEDEHFQYDESLFGEEHYWSFRKERSHINFGKKTREELKEIVGGKGIAVCNFFDPRGRFSVAAFRLELEDNEIEGYLDRVNKWPCQVQPYLFDDNVRTRIMGGEGHTLENLGARLMMLGHEVADGSFKVVHMEPDDPPALNGVVEDGRSVVDALTSFAKPEECPSIPWEKINFNWEDSCERLHQANDFFQTSIAEFYRCMVPYCDLLGSPRNIGFGNYGEHLAAMVYGIRGTLTSARGGDLIENDGTESDVKVAAGWKGDSLGTESTPRYDLKELGPQRSKKRAKMMRWRRWIPIRILAIEEDEDWKLTASVQALNSEHMKEFHRILSFYQMDTMLNVNPNNEIFQPSITLGLRRRNDGLRTHNFLEAIRFTEGQQPVRGNGWDVATNEMDPCDCRFCQAQWVENHLG